MHPCVLLRHETPGGGGGGGGGAHYDWLLARRQPQGDDDRALTAFRVEERIDARPVSPFSAERIGDHRAVYLSYQGPLSGARGAVARVAEGVCRVLCDDADAFEVVVDWGAGELECLGAPLGGAIWRFTRRPVRPDG